MALLRAYRHTGDRYYSEAARKAGQCLVRGQLRSGGWDYRIEFDPKKRSRYAYRSDPVSEGKKQANSTTLDDDTTQAALRLLIELDKTLDFKDQPIHEAAEFGLASLLKAQYPIGAWPQRYEAFPDPAKFPVKRASFPESWPRPFPGAKYADFYTFNDNAIADVIHVMFLAAEVYGEPRYRRAAEQCGEFILRAQMPEPQPAWAQQYDAEMHPAWARKFEPPAVTGGESQGVMRILIELYTQTGDKKYLEPIPRAIGYLRKSALPDGSLARFYELKTNRPLFFTKDYQLTYSDADTPTHYAFKVPNGLDALERAYQRCLETAPRAPAPLPARSPSKPSKTMIGRAEQAIKSLDRRGRWTEEGRLKTSKDDTVRRVIDCRTFIRNVDALSEYLATRE
jgi:PelA/Pel-15E family pectate lyase